MDQRLSQLSKMPVLLQRYEANLTAFIDSPGSNAAYASLQACVAELSVLFTADLTDLAYEFGEFVIAHSRLATAIQQARSQAHSQAAADPSIPQAAVTKARLACAGLMRAVQRLMTFDLKMR